MQSYAAIKQRIDITCKFERMDRSVMDAYIKRHLNYAGLENDIFSESALQAIYQFSAGSARLINRACTHVLIYASQMNKKIIDDHMISRVIDGELS